MSHKGFCRESKEGIGEKMKIAVITHWNCFENYGQVLQGYAFQQFLKHRGHDPFIIRYFPGSYFSDRLSVRRAIWRFRTFKSFWNSLKCLLLLTRFRARRRRLKIAKERNFQGFKDEEMVFSKNIDSAPVAPTEPISSLSTSRQHAVYSTSPSTSKMALKDV